MAKNVCKTSSGCHCKVGGWILLIAGLLYLAQDMGWIYWWTLNWYTVAFLLIGLCKVMKPCCK